MEFHGITVRDFDIFSLRGALYGVSFLPIGIVSCFVVGFLAVPLMFISELKILSKKWEKKHIVFTISHYNFIEKY